MVAARPKHLQTLPPDGTVLEELIATMQSEYGLPATPQEYRLLIRVPASEPEGSTSTAVAVQDPPDEEEPEGGAESPAVVTAPSADRSRRRRRRRRRPGGGAPSSPRPSVGSSDGGEGGTGSASNGE